MDERPKLTVEDGGLHRQQTLWIQGKDIEAIIKAAENIRDFGQIVEPKRTCEPISGDEFFAIWKRMREAARLRRKMAPDRSDLMRRIEEVLASGELN